MELFKKLHDEGYNAFMDLYSLTGDSKVYPQIFDLILFRVDYAGIIFFSKDFFGSEWCCRELHYLIEQKKKAGIQLIAVWMHDQKLFQPQWTNPSTNTKDSLDTMSKHFDINIRDIASTNKETFASDLFARLRDPLKDCILFFR